MTRPAYNDRFSRPLTLTEPLVGLIITLTVIITIVILPLFGVRL